MKGTGSGSRVAGLFRRRAKGRRVLDEVAGFSTLVGERACLHGHFEGADNCIIYGLVEGDCDLEGVLVVGEQARWRGNIRATHAVISGQVDGDVMIREKLELMPSARVTGAISSAAIAVAAGAIHEGEIRMEQRTDIVHFKEKRRTTTPRR